MEITTGGIFLGAIGISLAGILSVALVSASRKAGQEDRHHKCAGCGLYLRTVAPNQFCDVCVAKMARR